MNRKEIKINRAKIPVISLLSKGVLTGLAAVCPPFAFAQGAFELLGDIEIEKQTIITELIANAANNATKRVKEYYRFSIPNNKRNDKEFMFFLGEILHNIEYLEINEVFWINNDCNHLTKMLIDRIQKLDYYIKNRLTKNEAEKYLLAFKELFENYYYEEVANESTLSNYYTVILSIENNKNTKAIQNLSEQMLQNILDISQKIDDETELKKQLNRKLDRFNIILNRCEKAFTELVHGFTFVLVAYIIFLFTQNIFVFNKETNYDYYIIVFMSFSISEFIDKFLIFFQYLKFDYNPHRIRHILTSAAFQIIIVIVVLLLFSITDVRLIFCASLSKLLSELLKHISENR